MNGVALAAELDAAPWGERRATARRLAEACNVSVASVYLRAARFRAKRGQAAGLYDGPRIAAALALCPHGSRVNVARRLAAAYGCSLATIYRRAQPHRRRTAAAPQTAL